MYAKRTGFFRKQGIDAEIVLVADGTQTVPAVLSGQAQFAAVPPARLAILKSNKAPVKAVAAGSGLRARNRRPRCSSPRPGSGSRAPATSSARRSVSTS